MLLGCVKGDKMLKNDTIPLSLNSRIHSARQKSRVFFFLSFFLGCVGGKSSAFLSNGNLHRKNAMNYFVWKMESWVCQQDL